MRLKGVLGVVGWLLVVGCAGGPKVELLSPAPPAVTALIPPSETVPGWRMDGEVREYPGRKLFDFIDGAGEIHLTYGFVTVATADYVNDQEQYITVSVFQLASSEDAYGLNSYYSPSRGRAVGFGRDAKVLQGSCRFWKGPYYVEVQGDPLAALDPVAEALARWVAERIAEPGSPPDLLRLLPEEGRKTDPPIFLHHPLILSGLGFEAVAVQPQGFEALGLGEETDMVAAYYQGRFALSVTRYPEAEAARSALGAYQGAPGLATQVGPYLVATTAVSEPARAAWDEAVDRVKARLKEE